MLRIPMVTLTDPLRAVRYRLWLAVLLGVLTTLFFLTSAAFAAPVEPSPVLLTQPDGTEIVTIPFGDEWYSGYEYQGYTILLDPESNYWVYARQEGGGELRPGRSKAGIDEPPSVLRPSLRDRPTILGMADRGAEVVPEVWPGAFGPQDVLILLVDFTPSVSLSTTDAQWTNLFFDNTPGVRSVRNWYKEASFNQFDLVPATETYGTANDGVIAVQLGYAHPNPYPSDDNNKQITKDALIAADAYIDYSSFDANGNGSLDSTELHLMIIARGFEKSYGGSSGSCSPSVWGHRGGLGGSVSEPQLDGVYVGGDYTQEGEWHEYASDGCDGSLPGHMATMGIMVHEMGHDIDWPDLYDIDGSSAGVGYWSIMSGGSWGRASGDSYSGETPVLPDAFLKWYQGWLTPTEITAPQTGVAVPRASDNATAYLIGVNPNGIDWDFYGASGTGEYFLVENRQHSGFDAGLYRMGSNAKGCIIWHIDETRTQTNSANADETRRLVDVEEADGPPQDMDLSTGGNSGDDGDPWPGSTSETTFNGASAPNSHWYDGSASGIAITNISTAGTGCTVDFSGVGPTWDGSDSSDWNDTDNWTVGRTPNQNDNTVIPSGVPNWPNVNAAASVHSLAILDGAHLTTDSDETLGVYGDWTETGSGYFDASAGTVVFKGSSAQSITSWASSNFNNLQIGDGSRAPSVTAVSDLDVDGDLSIQAGAILAMGGQTLRVAGNWTDNPASFSPGTGTVILDGTAQTMQRLDSTVYSNDLTSTTGWTRYNPPSGGGFWNYSTATDAPNSPTDDHGQHGRYYFSSTAAADDWLFSPGFTLQAGVTYSISFNYGARNASYPEKLAVHIGNAQNVSAMTTQLFDNNNVTNTSWQQGSGTFTPGATGTYHVGFHAYSDADRYELAVDDLVVTALEPDLSFYDLTITNGSTATFDDSAAVQNNLTVDAGGTLALGVNDAMVEGTVTNNGSMAQVKTVNAASTAFLNLKNKAGIVNKYWGAAIDPGSNDMGSTTVTIKGNQDCTDVAGETVQRCFDIAPTTTSGLNTTVQFYFTDGELSGNDCNTLNAFHRNGSDWEGLTLDASWGGDGRVCETEPYSVQVKDVSDFSPFVLKSPAQPKTVTDLDVSDESGSLRLDWTAVTRDIADYGLASVTYDVYRATDSPYFTPGATYATGVTDTWYVDHDTGVIGDPDHNYTYLVRAVSSGLTSDNSARVGTFSFALTPGSE